MEKPLLLQGKIPKLQQLFGKIWLQYGRACCQCRVLGGRVSKSVVLTLMLGVNGPYHVKLHCSSEIFQVTSHEVLKLETVTIPKPGVSYMDQSF